jgi:hemoglobin/transferrin/lactoferrin receptor protein
VASALGAPLAARCQEPTAEDTVYLADPLVVTATRGLRAASSVPSPISVLQRRDLVEQAPNTVSDLFRTLPGLDVTGVGVQQVRPQIRGQSGQRILLLSDGLRMNNTRRQRDFGEIPALVDVGAIEQIEVVRGPASVLYGSDAIGGVVNLITERPIAQGFRPSFSYQYGSAAELSRFTARLQGRTGPLTVDGGASSRSAGTYQAPAGKFGDIVLREDVTVEHSGVKDRSFDFRLGWDVAPSVSVFAKLDLYDAEDAGFGFVPPDAYAPGEPRIEILYPDQRFGKLSGGVRATDLDFPLADAVSLTAYGQDNERHLVFDAFIPFSPSAGLVLANRNFTDIRTYGGRAEARKLLSGRVLLTYGADVFRDRAEGTDDNTSTVVGFGPPRVTRSAIPSIPHAALRSLGAFAQGEFDVGERLSFVVGGRYQDVSAESFATPGLANTPASRSHATWVGALNSMLELTPTLHLVASIGRGFRSPNLVELFFDGAVPEANAYQAASQDLEAETSKNVDVGLRYHGRQVFLELFQFRNRVSNGIRARPVLDQAGDTVRTRGLNTYRNVNIDRIVFQGLEANADVLFDSGLTLGGSYAELDAEDALDPDNPVGESYSTKATARVGFRDPRGRFWAQWEIRHSGEQNDAALGTGNPVGAVLPAFTVQAVRGGVRLFERGGVTSSLTLAVSNLTNELYAETANASFFRPEPKRHMTAGLSVTF